MRPPAFRIVLLVPGLRASDLSQPELPSLARLIAEGGSGWMVCRAARVTDTRLLRPDGRESNASLLVTLGSGSRALAPFAAPADSPNVRLHALQAANASLDHTVPLGALGRSLPPPLPQDRHSGRCRRLLAGRRCLVCRDGFRQDRSISP